MHEEAWKPVVGYEGKYEISNHGKIRSLNYHSTGLTRELKKRLDRYGYPCILLSCGKSRKHHTIHRLVAEAFIPNPENKSEVNHIDGDKQNNHVSNLEWVTMKENQRHAWAHGLKEKSREESSKRGKTDKTIKRLALYNEQRKKPIVARNVSTGEEIVFSTQREAARAINGDQGNINRVLRGEVSQHKGYTFRYSKEN